MRMEGRRHGVVPGNAAGEATAELKREAISTCSDLTDQQQHEDKLQAAFAVASVMARHKMPHETFMEYKKALRRTGENYIIPEAYYVAAFINGVGCQQLSHLLKESKPQDLDTAAKEAILLQRSDGTGPSLLGANAHVLDLLLRLDTATRCLRNARVGTQESATCVTSSATSRGNVLSAGPITKRPREIDIVISV